MKIDRRQFMELMGALTAFAAGCGAPKRETARDSDSKELASLGGGPDTHEGRTIAAFADTVIPGSPRDETPGALDAGVVASFFDPRLPAAPLAPLLVLVLDAFSDDRTFVELKPSQREKALAKAVEAVPQMRFAVQLVKVAFYASPVAGVSLGYPGENWGYADDDDFSFRTPMAEPHPKVLTSGDGEGHYE